MKCMLTQTIEKKALQKTFLIRAFIGLKKRMHYNRHNRA
jgi:hypothetical protein